MALVAPRQLNANDSSLKGNVGFTDDLPFDESDFQSPEVTALTHAVTLHLADALRAAKTSHLECGEVLFPNGLLSTIARDILRMADSEPSGLRGCLLHLTFESAQDLNSQPSLTPRSRSSSASSIASSSSDVSTTGHTRRSIGQLKWDPHAVPTFELSLTFREQSGPWYSRLSKFLRLSKKPSIILSEDFVLSKKKLYRSGRH